MKEITVDANVKHLDEVLAFMHQAIDGYDCSPDVLFQLEIALEEIYVNIAYYAYPNDVGSTTIRCRVEEEAGKPPMLVMDILDQGSPYNPLDREDPDIDLEADEREIGGLGIYMVKHSVDSLSYRYEEESNIFTISKYLHEEKG